MTAVVDARFAGGSITVDTGRLTHGAEESVVILDGTGFEFPLFAHEACALADALRLAAEATEQTRPLRRPPEVDEQLRAQGDV